MQELGFICNSTGRILEGYDVDFMIASDGAGDTALFSAHLDCSLSILGQTVEVLWELLETVAGGFIG